MSKEVEVLDILLEHFDALEGKMDRRMDRFEDAVDKRLTRLENTVNDNGAVASEVKEDLNGLKNRGAGLLTGVAIAVGASATAFSEKITQFKQFIVG